MDQSTAPTDEDKPFWKKGWFWVVVGLVVFGISFLVFLYVYLKKMGSDSQPQAQTLRLGDEQKTIDQSLQTSPQLQATTPTGPPVISDAQNTIDQSSQTPTIPPVMSNLPNISKSPSPNILIGQEIYNSLTNPETEKRTIKHINELLVKACKENDLFGSIDEVLLPSIVASLFYNKNFNTADNKPLLLFLLELFKNYNYNMSDNAVQKFVSELGQFSITNASIFGAYKKVLPIIDLWVNLQRILYNLRNGKPYNCEDLYTL